MPNPNPSRAFVTRLRAALSEMGSSFLSSPIRIAWGVIFRPSSSSVNVPLKGFIGILWNLLSSR